MRKLIPVLILTSLAGAGCDSTEPTSVAKSSPKVAATAGPETCEAYFSEVVKMCRDSFFGGLKMSCSTAIMKAEMAYSQKKGNLFEDPDGKVSAAEMGDFLCGSNIRSLRKKLSKAEIEPKKNWGPKCTSFFNKLESSCVAPVAQGVFNSSCTYPLMQVKSLKRKESPEDLCESYSGLVKD